MLRRIAAHIVLALATLALAVPIAAASVPTAATDTTITVQESGAIHIKVVQTVPDSRDGATTYHFDLQKAYSPENVTVYDAGTGKPLKVRPAERGEVIAYDVEFDRPYFQGYVFAVEYGSHRRIIYEGDGVYSLGMRPAVDVKDIDRTYTIILPPGNFTYLGYNAALDRPASETRSDGSVRIVFRNLTRGGTDYAWEIRFRATGIEGEVRKLDAPDYGIPVPGMTFAMAAVALVILAILMKKE